MKNYHLQLAGKYSISAHNNWLAALRDATQDAVKSDALTAGDAAWARAEKHLRLAGTGDDNITDVEREMLTTDECFNPPGSDYDLVTDAGVEIDFEPLERAMLLDKATGLLQLFVLVVLLGGVSYLYGYNSGREAGAYPTAEEFMQLKQLNDEFGDK